MAKCWKKSTECDAYDKSQGLRINDLSLVLDCISCASGPLIRGDIVSCVLVLGIYC